MARHADSEPRAIAFLPVRPREIIIVRDPPGSSVVQIPPARMIYQERLGVVVGRSRLKV